MFAHSELTRVQVWYCKITVICKAMYFIDFTKTVVILMQLSKVNYFR